MRVRVSRAVWRLSGGQGTRVAAGCACSGAPNQQTARRAPLWPSEATVAEPAWECGRAERPTAARAASRRWPRRRGACSVRGADELPGGGWLPVRVVIFVKALKTEEEGTTSKRPLSRSARCDSEHLAPAAPLHPATGRQVGGDTPSQTEPPNLPHFTPPPLGMSSLVLLLPPAMLSVTVSPAAPQPSLPPTDRCARTMHATRTNLNHVGINPAQSSCGRRRVVA